MNGNMQWANINDYGELWEAFQAGKIPHRKLIDLEDETISYLVKTDDLTKEDTERYDLNHLPKDIDMILFIGED